jgi:hypothetical protein
MPRRELGPNDLPLEEITERLYPLFIPYVYFLYLSKCQPQRTTYPRSDQTMLSYQTVW